MNKSTKYCSLSLKMSIPSPIYPKKIKQKHYPFNVYLGPLFVPDYKLIMNVINSERDEEHKIGRMYGLEKEHLETILKAIKSGMFREKGVIKQYLRLSCEIESRYWGKKKPTIEILDSSKVDVEFVDLVSKAQIRCYRHKNMVPIHLPKDITIQEVHDIVIFRLLKTLIVDKTALEEMLLSEGIDISSLPKLNTKFKTMISRFISMSLFTYIMKEIEIRKN